MVRSHVIPRGFVDLHHPMTGWAPHHWIFDCPAETARISTHLEEKDKHHGDKDGLNFF